MPYVILAPPDAGITSGGNSVSELGQNLAKYGVAFGELLERRRANKKREELEARKLDLLEARGKAKIAKDEATAAMVEQDLTTLGRRQSERVGAQGVQNAAENPVPPEAGMLGPFGALDPTRIAAAGAAQAAMAVRSAERVKIASTMPAADARAYLTKKAGEDKVEQLGMAHAATARHIQRAQAAGWIDDKMAKDLNDTLQSAIREGHTPDGVERTLAKIHKAQAKLLVRSEGWQKADKQAEEWLTAMQQAVSGASTDVATQGTSPMEDAANALADAQQAWAETKLDPEYRKMTDPQAALAKLHGILLGYQAKANPQGFIEDSRQQMLREHEARGEAPFRPLNQRGPEAEARMQAQQGKKTPRTSAQVLEARGKERPTPRTQLSNMVLDSAGEVLRAGKPAERKQRIGELRMRIAKELGIDPTSPEAFAATREALSAAYQPQ